MGNVTNKNKKSSSLKEKLEFIKENTHFDEEHINEWHVEFAVSQILIYFCFEYLLLFSN
jgi:hypothetical protein